MLNPLNFITKLIKTSNQKELDKLKKTVELVNNKEDEIAKLQDIDFPKKTEELKKKIKEGSKLDELLPEAYALTREASKRSRGERHFDVQIMGGIALHQGKIAEMKTGEGKTLAKNSP